MTAFAPSAVLSGRLVSRTTTTSTAGPGRSSTAAPRMRPTGAAAATSWPVRRQCGSGAGCPNSDRHGLIGGDCDLGCEGVAVVVWDTALPQVFGLAGRHEFVIHRLLEGHVAPFGEERLKRVLLQLPTEGVAYGSVARPTSRTSSGRFVCETLCSQLRR
jgi:hypothetical protein